MAPAGRFGGPSPPICSTTTGTNRGSSYTKVVEEKYKKSDKKVEIVHQLVHADLLQGGGCEGRNRVFRCVCV